MNSARKIILSIVTLFLFFGVFSSPVFAAAQDEGKYTYLFHLYYDNGRLVADRDFEFKYDLIAEEFVPETITIGSPYRGEVISIKNVVEATFQFDIKRNDPTFTKGKISIKGPYFADASETKFYNDRGQLLLTLNVGGSSFCNDDGICNKDVGEDSNNCPADCKSEPIASPLPIKGGGLLRGILIALGVVIAAVVIWVSRAIIKKRKIGADLPPPLPPSNPPAIQ